MILEQDIKDKLKKGWIKSSLWFEVLATDEKTAEESLHNHIEKLKSMSDNIVINENYKNVEKVENPMRDIQVAYSQVVNVTMLTKDIETLLFAVITFAPSGIEILEPKEFKINTGTMQAIMNSVADVIHRLALIGVGGVVISTKR